VGKQSSVVPGQGGEDRRIDRYDQPRGTGAAQDFDRMTGETGADENAFGG
jgi:hypothetical protein